MINLQETHSPHDNYINTLIGGSEFVAYESINMNNHNNILRLRLKAFLKGTFLAPTTVALLEMMHKASFKK